MFFKKKKKKAPIVYKRKAERYMVYLPAVMYVLDNQYEKRHVEHLIKKHKLVAHRGVIINVSPKGMLLLRLPSDIMHKHQPPVKEKISVALKFHLPIMMNEISIDGTVVHVQNKDEDFPEVSLIGIEFAKVSFMDIVSLEEYIHADTEELTAGSRNKRKFARLKTDRSALISDGRRKIFNEQKAKIGDISASGLLVTLDAADVSASAYDKLKTKEIKELIVVFNVAVGGRLIKVLCEICRVDLIDNKLFLGLRFTEISEKDQLTVLKYVALRRERLLGEE